MSDENKSITVSGVTFTAEQVKSAVIKIDDREIVIKEEKKEKKIGFDK
jgi:hypothetical protein